MQKILKISVGFWKKLSDTYIRPWITQDMLAGSVQAFIAQTKGTKGGAKSYSDGYRKYKVNSMNRFTTRKYGAKVRVSGKIMKSTKAYIAAAGTKLKGYTDAYGSASVQSTSSTPNMMLTGQTIKGLEYERSTDTSLTMKYKDKDEKKIIYNEEMGRVITTLNEKNIDKTVKLIEDELVRNISEWYKGKIIINVGK